MQIFIFSLRVGTILDHFGYPAPSLTEWQQHIWYDLGAIHSCVYEMRNRLAMGRSPQPRSMNPVASATAAASSVRSHPHVGQKMVKIPPESAPAAPTTGQSAETPPQPSSAKGKDKRKRRKKKENDTSPSRPKKSKKRAAPVASSDTEIYEDPTVKDEGAPVGAAPPESSDSQAEGPFTNRSDSDGTESALEAKEVLFKPSPVNSYFHVNISRVSPLLLPNCILHSLNFCFSLNFLLKEFCGYVVAYHTSLPFLLHNFFLSPLSLCFYPLSSFSCPPFLQRRSCARR